MTRRGHYREMSEGAIWIGPLQCGPMCDLLTVEDVATVLSISVEDVLALLEEKTSGDFAASPGRVLWRIQIGKEVRFSARSVEEYMEETMQGDAL